VTAGGTPAQACPIGTTRGKQTPKARDPQRAQFRAPRERREAAHVFLEWDCDYRTAFHGDPGALIDVIAPILRATTSTMHIP
jgi:hypothetical protein